MRKRLHSQMGADQSKGLPNLGGPNVVGALIMNSLKTMSVSLAMLVGASTLAIGSASASPLSNFYSQYHSPNSNIELVAEKKWQYDSSRHGKRFRKRDNDHVHFYGGFWYASPFWMLSAPVYGNRMSCAEARRILRQRYDRVRTIECNGRIYTFAAVNNRGRVLEVSFNSRTGSYWRS
jgi:hypothetical protein